MRRLTDSGGGRRRLSRLAEVCMGRTGPHKYADIVSRSGRPPHVAEIGALGRLPHFAGRTRLADRGRKRASDVWLNVTSSTGGDSDHEG